MVLGLGRHGSFTLAQTIMAASSILASQHAVAQMAGRGG